MTVQPERELDGLKTRACLADAIRSSAVDLGYSACGITTAEPFSEYAAALDRLCVRHPDLAERLEPFRKRIDPKGNARWAQSIVVCVRRYGTYRIPPGLTGHIGRNYLCDRRIPACPDHARPKRMTEALRKLGLRTRRGSGTSDRCAAARAGVARLARNTFAVTEEAGSWINIESWRVNAALPPDPPSKPARCPDGCRACIDACPTGALCAPHTLRMDRCIAWLSFSAPWPVAPELEARMGPWIYGCDVCQEVCPLNRGRWIERDPAPWLEREADLLRPENLAVMTDETYRTRVYPLFGYIPETEAERWRAQARRALRAPVAGKRPKV